MTKRTSTSIAAIAATVAIAVAAAGALAFAAPQRALAGEEPEGYVVTDNGDDSHCEGEPVTIWPNEGESVSAEWYRDEGGYWWATFTTYNETVVYATPASEECGWMFFVEEPDGSFTQVARTDAESTEEPGQQLGPRDRASHWRELAGDRWF